MQIYWLPVIFACLALLVSASKALTRSKPIVLLVNYVSVFAFVLMLILYSGVNSDWAAYRDFVTTCAAPGCTYFEPGYDYLTYLSSVTLGFATLKLLLIVSYLACIYILIRGASNNLLLLLVVASVSVAALPLMLGAIRQSLTLPLLLGGAVLLERKRYTYAGLLFVAAGTLHYSALVVGIWYLVFWNALAKTGQNYSLTTAFIRVILIVTTTFLFFLTLVNSSLGNTIYIIARIGATGVGTDAIATGGIGRDLAILAERIPFSLLALIYLVKKSKYVSTTAKVSLLMYVAGSAFFTAIFLFDRNIAGRTLATFRLADIVVIYLVIQNSIQAGFRPLATPAAVGIALLFVILKSYMTMSTVGFFDE